MDAAGRLFVSRAAGWRVQRLAPDGQLEAEWTGIGETARPEALAIGPSGSLYVGDSFNGRVDRYSLDGEHLGTVFGAEVDGPKPRIAAIAVGADDRLVVADQNGRRLILASPDGGLQTLSTSDLGLGEKASLGAVAFDPSGAVLVTVNDDARVLRVTLG